MTPVYKTDAEFRPNTCLFLSQFTMAANQARVAAEICLSGLIMGGGGGHCACGRAVGKGDVMGFFVAATEDRKGRNAGAEEKKKRPPILRKFLVPVASRKHCWEDNVTEAALHPIISVTGREEILEHVLILTLLGGGAESCNTLNTFA